MSLGSEYDVCHQLVFEEAPEHEDASSPWYQLVRERLGPVAGLHILEVACGRGGWTILHTDGTVHQFPFIPGRNPVGFPSLEKNHALRKLLSPLAYHYFVIAQKESAA